MKTYQITMLHQGSTIMAIVSAPCAMTAIRWALAFEGLPATAFCAAQEIERQEA